MSSESDTPSISKFEAFLGPKNTKKRLLKPNSKQQRSKFTLLDETPARLALGYE